MYAIRSYYGISKTIDWYLANQQWVDSVMDGSYQEYYQQMYAIV